MAAGYISEPDCSPSQPHIKMAGRLWKNSAGLILAHAKNCRYALAGDGLPELSGSPPKLGPLLSTSKEASKDAIEVLFVQRSVQSEFMGDTHVYPGGKLDEADHSQQWVELYRTLARQSIPDMMGWFKSNCRERLPIYESLPSDGIPGEVSLRINAIRETFEESGILMLRDAGRMAEIRGGSTAGSIRPTLKVLEKNVVKKWRERVHDNAYDFITMCRELQSVPDVWSLVEWSNWLTPENLPRRYDTVFYLCCTEDKLDPSADYEEISSTQWVSISDALAKFATKEMTLPPPQFTMATFLHLFPSLPCLHAFALHSFLAAPPQRMLPVRVLADKKIVSLLPSDDLYPSDYNADVATPVGMELQCQGKEARGKVTLKKTDNVMYEFEVPEAFSYNDLEGMSHNVHRMVFHGMSDYSLSDTVLHPPARRFIEEYQSAVLQHSHTTSKL